MEKIYEDYKGYIIVSVQGQSEVVVFGDYGTDYSFGSIELAKEKIDKWVAEETKGYQK